MKAVEPFPPEDGCPNCRKSIEEYKKLNPEVKNPMMLGHWCKDPRHGVHQIIGQVESNPQIRFWR